MAQEYSLPDEKKAWRCCLNWAAQTQVEKPMGAVAGSESCSLAATAEQASIQRLRNYTKVGSTIPKDLISPFFAVGMAR